MKIGTSSGRPQSALLIPVPAAERMVGAIRRRHDPVGAAGVPAHITLIVPWLEPGELDVDDDVVAEVSEVVADVKAFDFSLVAVHWFGERVLWLGPEPVQPFRELTDRLATRFDTPPWAGKFPEVVPHLTVGHAGFGGDLGPVAERMEATLPIACRAEEIWAMVGDGEHWQLYARVPLS